MNSILKKSLGFILVLFLMVFSLSTVVKVKALSFSFDFSTNSYSDSGESSVTWTNTDVTMSLEKNKSSTAANNYLGGGGNTHTRVYKDQKLSFIPDDSIEITSVVITATSSDYATIFANGPWTNATAEKSNTKVTVTPTDGTSQFYIVIGAATRATNVAVTYSSSSGNIDLSSIALTNVSLHPGQTGRTTITYSPANATDKAVTYAITAGSEYAEVANDGTITAKAAGVATLTVTPHDTNASVQTCSITVTDYPAPALTVGKSYILYANHANGNYQLSGVADNLGTGVAYDDFQDEDLFPLEVEEGLYVNTISLKNGNNYLALNSDENKLSLSNTKNANSSWIASLNESVYAVNNVAYQTRRIQFNYNKGNVRFATYSSNNTPISFYEIGSTIVTISSAGNATKAYLGETLSFNALTNVQNPVINWTSSNTSAATIDSNGVLHPAGIGRTNIKATINDVESDSIEITILPNPENPITIAQANAIAELVGTTKTTEIYKLDGSITYVDANSLTLTDNSGSILVYKSGHNLDNSFNDREVRVTGKIIKYEGTTNEITDNVTIAFYHTVTFNSNGGSDIASQKILDGGKANRPTPDPTKDGFTFNCWKNGGEIYNFNTNVTQDITLVAEWVGSTGTQILNLLNSTQTYMSLAYKYSVTTPFVSDVLTRSLTEVSGSTYTDWEDKTVNTSAIYKGNSAGSNSSIQLRSSSDSGIVTTTSGGYARKVIITFEGHTQEGRTIDIYGSDTQYTSPSDLYNNSLQGTKLGSIVYGTNTTLVISGNYQYIGIKSNDGTVYCSSIEIVWGAFGDADFRLRCGFNNSSFATDLAAISGEATYGIEVSTTSKTERFAQNNELIRTSGDMKYVLVDLGDALTNSNRLDLEFTVKVYVELDEVRYYATNDAMIKTYSVASMIETYYQNEEVKPLILNLYNLLVAMGKIE